MEWNFIYLFIYFSLFQRNTRTHALENAGRSEKTFRYRLQCFTFIVDCFYICFLQVLINVKVGEDRFYCESSFF